MNSPRQPECGYALLLVYSMAAAAAVLLYMQLPRVAFEAQREKEQLLIDRGEQYSRAVQLFVRKNNRFPPDIEALENTQSIRFLRKKYRDPITGKDDWRLIHVGPGGIFTDSLVHGPKKKGDQNGPQTFIAEMQQIGGNTTLPETGVNQAARRRASDQPGAPGNPNTEEAIGAFTPNGQPPGNSGVVPNGPVMVLPDGRIVPANFTGQNPVPGQPFPGQPFPGQTTGQPGAPGQNTYPSSGSLAFPPGPGQVGQPGITARNGIPQGFQTQPNTAGNPPGAAANIINQILTTPRPGGLNGVGDTGNTGTQLGQPLGGQTIGGGFAGVASKAEQEGIKTYKERTAYNEWEFVYDMTKDSLRAGGGGVAGSGGGPAPGSPLGGTPPAPPLIPLK